MSDVTLYPIRGQVAQVNGKNEYIIYVPRADKYTYGTVKIGEGLTVVDGVISVDAENAATIKTIAKNGTDLVPDKNKRVNIEITKADVGLNNVENTADLDKPISTATQAAIDKLSHDLMDDVMNVQESLDDYKLVVDNKFAEQKSDVDGRLLVINNTISQNKTQTDSAIERIEEVLEGKEQSVAFNNYQTVVNTFNMAATNKYNVGQSIYVQSVNVPDLWVYSIENTHIDFAYIGDEDIIETLEINGTVQFGYYKLAMMETKTTSVANAVTLDTNQTIIGVKTYDIDDSFAKFDAEYVTLQHKNGSRLSAIYVGDKLELGSVGTDGTTFKGITHDPSTYITNINGVLQYNGSDVLSKTSIVDSDSILVSEDSLGKLKFELDNEITNKIQKSLIVPMSAPSTTELVAIDDGNSQTMVEIGDGLSLENGVLKATGGGGSEGGSGVVLLREDFSTIDGLYNKLAELYNSNKDFVVSMTPTSSLSGSFYTMQITSTAHAPTDAGNTGTIMSANRTYRFRLVEKGSDYFMLAGVNNVDLTLKVYSWNNINATLKGLNSGSATEFIFNVISSSVSTTTFAKLGTSVYYYATESSEAIQQILNTEV